MTEWLTIKEAAAQLGVHSDTVRRMIRDGKLASEKRGNGKTSQRYIPASAIDTIRTTKEVVAVTHDADVTALIEQQRTLLELVQQLVLKVDAMSEELATLKAEHEPVPVPLPVPDVEPSAWQRFKNFFRLGPETKKEG